MSDQSLRGLGVEVRFWAKVDKNGPIPVARPDLGKCWQWTASTFGDSGYGAFNWNGRTGRAHRYSYELNVGPIPDGLVIDHLCRNHSCVNPDHLEPVTDPENLRRGEGVPAKNARRETCLRGHRYDRTGTNWNGKPRRICSTCQEIYSRASYLRKRERRTAA